jgi:hypothetical protein
MKKIINSLLLSVFLVSTSCSQNIPLDINIIRNEQNNFIKGTVRLDFKLSDFKSNNNSFKVKNFDLTNPEISKLRLEIVGKGFTPVNVEKPYISGQTVSFELQAPIGKNRVIILYTLDKMGNILSQFMGALDIKAGDNKASISFIDTVIAQVLYSMILDKNERFQDNYSNGGSSSVIIYPGMPTPPPDPFASFDLSHENTKLLESLNLEDLKKYVYDYTGFNKEQNYYTKKDPLTFNSIWLAKQLVQNYFLKKELYPPINSIELSGLTNFYLYTQYSDFNNYSSKFKINFSDLKSPSGIYTSQDLQMLGRFAMPGIWNISLFKAGYPTINKQITIDPNCCGYYISLEKHKMDRDKSYHSGEITLNTSNYSLTKNNAEITIVNDKGEVLMTIPAQDGYYLLKDFPITINSDMLKQLKEGNLYFNVLDKLSKKQIKGKIISNNFTDIYVYFRSDTDIYNSLEGSKITIKSLESNKNFNESVFSGKNYALVKNVPVGKIEIITEKEGYVTRTKIMDTNNDGTSAYFLTYKIDTTAPKIISINLGYDTNPSQPGDIGIKRDINVTDTDNNMLYSPNLDSISNYSIDRGNLSIYFNFNSPVKRESFENNFKILSEISNIYKGKEIVRGTSSDDAGFVPAFVIDKNTIGASFIWSNDDRTVRFLLQNNILWLNSNKELKYKLTFSAPFEDLSGQKAYSATSNSSNLTGSVISSKGGYIKYNNSVFADYLTFSVKKDYTDSVRLESWGKDSEGNKLNLSLTKPMNLLGKSLIPKLDLNGNIINNKLIYDKLDKQIKYVDIDGKIKSFIKLYIKKSGSKTEEAFDIDNLINYSQELSRVNLYFDKRAYNNYDTIYLQLLINGIDGSVPSSQISYM